MAQTKKELIEKLEGLATFFTMASSDAGGQAELAKLAKVNTKLASFPSGRELASNVAFLKLDTILKEARK